MSLLHKEACPKCRKHGHDLSGDNLAVYSDNHKWCFRCGYYVPSEVSLTTVKEQLNGINNTSGNTVKTCEHLPIDISSSLPAIAKDWLIQYEITPLEMRRFWWSESKQQVIYPVFDTKGELIFWQARNFGKAYLTDMTKYYTSGNVVDNLHVLGAGEVLILVEDVVSAIKISRQYKVMPLFGSFINKQNIIRLRDYILDAVLELGIWLDPDKFADASRICKQAQQLGIRAFTIMSQKDPKEYNDTEIQGLIEHWRNT